MLMRGLVRQSVLTLTAAFILADCSGHTVPQPIAQISPLSGRLSTGIIVAVRTIYLGNDEGAVKQVLVALNQPQTDNREPAVEIVIRRQDNTFTSVVQSQKAGQPRFLPGERIAIVEAAATAIKQE